MKVLENVPLADIVYYRIGGKARFVLKVDNQKDVLQALQFIQSQRIDEVLVLGLGSNILLSDKDFGGAVLWMQGDGKTYEIGEEGKVKAFAGETLDSLIEFSLRHSLVGLEWAAKLPSTVGGAIRGNAGAFGSEIKDVLFSVDVVDRTDPELTIKQFSLQDCNFSYRHSYFKDYQELIIIGGTFQLKKGTDEEVAKAKDVYQRHSNYRQTHHPMEYPSCGSVFKNITNKEEMERIFSVWPEVRELSEKKWHNKVSMGYVINRLGFSGKRVGGAMVSPQHANYIVNVDHAKAIDVRALITDIQHASRRVFGFVPELELIMVDR